MQLRFRYDCKAIDWPSWSAANVFGQPYRGELPELHKLAGRSPGAPGMCPPTLGSSLGNAELVPVLADQARKLPKLIRELRQMLDVVPELQDHVSH